MLDLFDFIAPADSYCHNRHIVTILHGNCINYYQEFMIEKRVSNFHMPNPKSAHQVTQYILVYLRVIPMC